MSNPSNENNLTKRHYATLILRLMLDQHGRLVHGDIVDVTNTRQEHFIGDYGLIQAVQAWLTRQERKSAADDPQAPQV